MKKFIFVCMAAVCLNGSLASADLINELEPTDNTPPLQSVEVKGLAGGTSFLDVIGLDAGGVIQDASLSVQVNYDSNGLAQINVTTLPTASYTLLLTTGFSQVIGTDLDTNDDGVLDSNPWAIFHDAVGVRSSATDNVYAGGIGGNDFEFLGEKPNLIFRDGTTDDWYATIASDGDSVFDLTGYDVLQDGSFDIDPFTPTFGGVNPSFSAAVPEPTSASLLSLLAGGLVLARRKRS